MVLFCLLRLLSALAALVPLRVVQGMGRGLGICLLGVARYRAAHLRAALARAGLPELDASAVYASLGEGALELLWLAGRRRRVEALVMFPRRSELTALLAEGPVVYAASHTANWELAVQHAATFGPVACLARRQHSEGANRFIDQLRGSYGVRVERRLEPLLQGLRRGQSVAVVIDQVPADARHAVRASFLGAEVWVDRSAALLAARARVPLVTMAQVRLPDGRHAQHLLAVTHPRTRRDVTRATVAATRALAQFVQRFPTAWLWTHRRWRVPPRAIAQLGAPIKAEAPGQAL